MIRDGSPWARLLLVLDAAVMRATGEAFRCPATMNRHGRRWACRRRYGHPGQGDARRPGSHVWRDDGELGVPAEIHEGWAGQ